MAVKEVKKKEEAEFQKKKEDSLRILDLVIGRLGIPPQLHPASRVTNIDGKRYRVNIYQTVENQVKLTDSFFMKFGEEGEILFSNPPLLRRYK